MIPHNRSVILHHNTSVDHIVSMLFVDHNLAEPCLLMMLRRVPRYTCSAQRVRT